MGLYHPRPPNFESLPYPGVGGGFDFFFFVAKMKKNDGLKDIGSNFPLCCAFLSTRAKTFCGGGVCCNPPSEI